MKAFPDKPEAGSEDVRITILADEQAPPGLTPEHGFSLWIEAGGRRILFDTGFSGVFARNARALGIDPLSADAVVLSHGHYDHTGGIPHLLREARNPEIYFHPRILVPRYSIRNGRARAIGAPPETAAALAGVPPEKLRRVLAPLELDERIGLTGPIPRESGFEDTGGPFFLDPEGKHPDPIEDDLALWIGTAAGAIVCLGCAHAGLVNTLARIRRLTGDGRIRAVIGGFHLLNASSERLGLTADFLRRLGPDLVVPCHCTGADAAAALRVALGKAVEPGRAGAAWRF